MFSDFQCPFCARVEPTLEELEETYPDDGARRLEAPAAASSMHPQARPAAEAAEAARAQGKFWEMHEKLFANQRALVARAVRDRRARDRARPAGFKRAVAANSGTARIDEDAEARGRGGRARDPHRSSSTADASWGRIPSRAIKPMSRRRSRTPTRSSRAANRQASSTRPSAARTCAASARGDAEFGLACASGGERVNRADAPDQGRHHAPTRSRRHAGASLAQLG